MHEGHVHVTAGLLFLLRSAPLPLRAFAGDTQCCLMHTATLTLLHLLTPHPDGPSHCCPSKPTWVSGWASCTSPSPDLVLRPDSSSHSQCLRGTVPSSGMSSSLRVCSAEVVSSVHQGGCLIYRCALIRTCGACPRRGLWFFTLPSSRDFHPALERFVREHPGVLYKMT